MAVDERTAIAQLQRGEIRGLDALMLIYQVRALRAAFVVTRDLTLAEDIVQSAFIHAYERIEQLDTTRSFGPWFLRSVVNSAIRAAEDRDDLNPWKRPTIETAPVSTPMISTDRSRTQSRSSSLQRQTMNSGRHWTGYHLPNARRRSCASILSCPRQRRLNSSASRWAQSSRGSTPPGRG